MSLFKRRRRLPILKQLRNYLWPYQGVRRTMHYYRHRMFRLPGTAHSISLGAAMGVAMSFAPLGLHEILAITLASLLRCSIFAAAIVAFVVGNFATYILFLAPLTLTVGNLLRGTMSHRFGATNGVTINFFDFIHHPAIVLERYGKSFLVGWLVLSLVSGAITYFLTKRAVIYAHKQRAERLRRRWLRHRKGGVRQ